MPCEPIVEPSPCPQYFVDWSADHSEVKEANGCFLLLLPNRFVVPLRDPAAEEFFRHILSAIESPSQNDSNNEKVMKVIMVMLMMRIMIRMAIRMRMMLILIYNVTHRDHDLH